MRTDEEIYKELTGSGRMLQTSIDFGSNQNPDAHAQIQRSAKKLNVPVDLAERNPEINKIVSDREIYEKLQSTEYLKKSFQNPNFASVAHDDVDALSKVENSFSRIRGPEPGYISTMKGLHVGAVEGFEKIRQGIRMQWADLIGSERMRKSAEQKFAAAETKTQRFDPEFETSTMRGVYGGLTSLTRQAPALIASVIAKSPVPALMAMGVGVEAEAYPKYRARGAAPEMALLGSVGEGAVEVATELMPMGFLVSKFGKVGAGEFLAGLLARELPSEQVAEIVQSAIDTAIANPDKTWGDYFKERPEAAYETLIATIVQSGIVGGAGALSRYGSDVNKSEDALNKQEALDGQIETVNETKLKSRSPEEMKKFLDEVVGAEEEVFLSPEDAEVFFQSNPEILETLPPELQETITEALAVQGDVVIQKSDYLTYLSEYHDQLTEVVRNDMDGMNAKEANEWVEQGNEQFEAEAERILEEQEVESEFRTSAETVATKIKEQIVKTGRFTEEAAEKYSQLHKAFAVTVADRIGKTPEEVYEQFGLEVRGAPVIGDMVLEQRTPEELGLNVTDTSLGKQYSTDAAHITVMEDAEFAPRKNSITDFVVEESERGKGVGRKILSDVLRLYDPAEISAAASSESSVALFYANGFRPATKPGATLKESFTKMQEDSSVTMVIPPEEVDAYMAKLHEAHRADQAENRVRLEKVLAGEAYEQAALKAGDVQTFSDNLEKSLGLKSLNLFESNGDLKLDTIIVPKGERKEGVGTKAMQAIIDFADSKGLRVTLTPAVKDDFQGTTSRARLVKFYKRFGFVENKGRKKDFTISESMYREPVAALYQTPVVDEESEQFKNWAGGADVQVIEGWGINDFDFTGEGPFVVKVYHGTTHEFDAFDATRGNFEGQFGAVNYFTSSEQDASDNYAGEGPDLTSRIEQRSEQLQQKLEDQFDEKGRKEVLDSLYRSTSELRIVSAQVADMDDSDAAYEVGKVLARRELSGGGEQTLELFVKMENPFIVGGETQWLEFVDNEETQKLAIEQVADNNDLTVKEVEVDIDTYEDEIDEARWDIEADQEHPLAEAIQVVATRNDVDAAELAGQVYELGSEATSDSIEALMRESESMMYAEGEKGELIGFHLIGEIIEELGYDAIILKNAESRFKTMDIEQGTAHVHVFDSGKTNIKSVENVGAFDPTDPSIYRQEARGQIQFDDGALITLLENADLSTFLHESGHFFFESYKTLAAENPEIAQDMQTLLDFVEVENLEVWNGMTLEQRRDGHEKVARAFEAYLFEGKSPNIEMQSLFSRFRDWLLNVYQNLAKLNVTLTPEVTQVFDRMLATKEQIREKEVARAYEPLFESAEEAGMTEKQWIDYQNMDERRRVMSESQLQTRSLRDMKWLSKAKGKALRELQKEAKAKRKAMRAEVAEEVSRETTYQAMNFAKKGELLDSDVKAEIHKIDLKTVEETYEGAKSDPKVVDSEIDGLQVAIAKLGGLSREESEAQGIDPADFTAQPVFGKRVFKRGGLSFDGMAEQLSQLGYLPEPYTANDLLNKLDKDLRGDTQYSVNADFDKIRGMEAEVDWRNLGTGKTGMLGKDGLHPDIVAEMFGFTSGDELIQRLSQAEPQKTHIDRLTDERMLETYGDLTDPVVIERAAEEAIHNEAHTRFLHTELSSLTKRAATGNVLSRAAKQYAEEAISRKKIREIRPFQYAAAETRAAKNAEKSIIQGDRDSAAEHKRAQVLNNHFFRAANNAQTETEKMVRYLKKFDREGTRKNLRGEYLEQIDALLARFDLRKSVTLKEIDSLAKFMESEADRLDAVNVDIDPKMADERFKKHYKEMTLEEVRGLRDTLKQLEHLARREQNMYIERRNMMFEEEKQAILGELREVHPKVFDEEDQPIPYKKDTRPAIKEFSGKFKSKFDAEFLNLENLLESMTLGKGEQIFDSLFGRLSEAADDQSTLMKEISDFLSPFTKAYSVKERLAFSSSKIKLGDEYFTREKRIAIALNYGNPEGRQRLIDGNEYSEPMIRKILETLEKRDIDFVNAFWAMSDTIIWPRLKGVDERTKGLPAKKVEALSYETSKGILTGGYVPLVYDGDLDVRAYDYNTDDAIRDLRGGTATSAATRQSASKQRLDRVKKPLNLSLTGMTYKINETIHDVTHREAVTDTYRLMKSKRIGNAIKNISGPDVYNALLQRVREVAVKPIVPQGFTERTLWYARRNTLINMMGASFNTVAINVLGVSPAIRQVGAGRFLKAMSKLTSLKGRKLYDWVMEDEYMRERIRGYDRDLSTEANRFLGKGNIGPSMSTWLIGLGMMDRAVTVPAYVAAFEKGMGIYNNDSKAARQFAGRVIRQTQGSGRTVDLAKISGGAGAAGEFKRIITMYYNFFSAQLGQMVVSQRISSKEWSEGRRIKAAQRMTLTTLGVITIPATLEAIARGQCGDSLDEIFENLPTCAARSSLLFAGQLFPVFRDIFPTMLKQFDPETQAFSVRLSPVEAAMETVAKLPKATIDVATGDFTEGDVSNLIKGVGYLAPGPGFQANRTLDGYMALMNGETDNPMVILTGAPRD